MKDIPIRSIVAGAGFWENLWNDAGSINFESNSIFDEAKRQSAMMKAPENFCPKGCTVSRNAVVIFDSVPKEVLTTYEDAAKCAALEAQSLKRPYTYQSNEIQTIDDLNAWISKLSRGKGREGKDLYARCDGDCSPRYEYTIARKEGLAESYSVSASIVCGAARDKDDNKYNLKAVFRWYCE